MAEFLLGVAFGGGVIFLILLNVLKQYDTKLTLETQYSERLLKALNEKKKAEENEKCLDILISRLVEQENKSKEI